MTQEERTKLIQSLLQAEKERQEGLPELLSKLKKEAPDVSAYELLRQVKVTNGVSVV